MNRKMLSVLCFITLFGPSLISSQAVSLGTCRLNCDGHKSEAITKETYDRTILLQRIEELETLINKSKKEFISDCSSPLLDTVKGEDSVQVIYPFADKSKTVKARCDMTTEPGGWTVIQHRVNGDLSFNKTWQFYVDGFEDVDDGDNLWIGLQNMHALTKDGDKMLRVEFTNADNDTGYAEYSTFIIGSSDTNYKLNIGGYSGNAGDSITNQNNMAFSTRDRNNDNSNGDCASNSGGGGGWWYNDCGMVNLNGQYGRGYGEGIMWYSWDSSGGSMMNSTMKIRSKI